MFFTKIDRFLDGGYFRHDGGVLVPGMWSCGPLGNIMEGGKRVEEKDGVEMIGWRRCSVLKTFGRESAVAKYRFHVFSRLTFLLLFFSLEMG